MASKRRNVSGKNIKREMTGRGTFYLAGVVCRRNWGIVKSDRRTFLTPEGESYAVACDGGRWRGQGVVGVAQTLTWAVPEPVAPPQPPPLPPLPLPFSRSQESVYFALLTPSPYIITPSRHHHHYPEPSQVHHHQLYGCWPQQTPQLLPPPPPPPPLPHAYCQQRCHDHFVDVVFRYRKIIIPINDRPTKISVIHRQTEYRRSCNPSDSVPPLKTISDPLTVIIRGF
ncbi:hypothetical protein AAG570_012240 [Ranatra chinensis]|uniref:Uncharacterized protein n=1 Tax=Ranatra chinensis TaxID=642074 RepID=A0ABD0YII0_9HEMI